MLSISHQGSALPHVASPSVMWGDLHHFLTLLRILTSLSHFTSNDHITEKRHYPFVTRHQTTWQVPLYLEISLGIVGPRTDRSNNNLSELDWLYQKGYRPYLKILFVSLSRDTTSLSVVSTVSINKPMNRIQYIVFNSCTRHICFACCTCQEWNSMHVSVLTPDWRTLHPGSVIQYVLTCTWHTHSNFSVCVIRSWYTLVSSKDNVQMILSKNLSWLLYKKDFDGIKGDLTLQ
jgi:hypothetical protein